MSSTEDTPSSLLCRFGLLADVQYADLDNGLNFTQDRTRYYRSALTLLDRAVTEIRKPKHDVRFLLQPGDLIDRHAPMAPGTQVALERTLQKLHSLHTPVYHVWGNHEFYNFSRAALLQSELNSAQSVATQMPSEPRKLKPPANANCYQVSPSPGLRLVVLDQYEVSLLGYEEDSEEYQSAERILRAHNKNEDLNSPEGLVGVDRRFAKFNGAISDQQLQWLDSVLQDADAKGEMVIVAGHLPIYQPSTDEGLCLCWNYQEILTTLQKFSCVKAYIAGHDHDGGFATDDDGIHHITVEAIIETPPDEDAFAVVEVHTDRLIVKGFGRVPSRELMYRECGVTGKVNAAL